jgi:O-antigen ligase
MSARIRVHESAAGLRGWSRPRVLAALVLATVLALSFAPRTGAGRVVYWAAAYGAALTPLVVAWPGLPPRLAVRRLRWPDLAVIAFVGWVVISLLFVSDAPQSTGALILEAWLKVGMPAGLYLAVRLTGLDVATLAGPRCVIGVALVLMTALAMVSVAAPGSMPGFWPVHAVHSPLERDVRATGPFSGPVALALVTAFLMVLAVAPGWPRRPRWWTGVMWALGLVTIALSFLRAAWVGALAGILAGVVARGGRVAARVLAVLVAAVLVSAVGLAVSGHVRDRVASDRQVESRVILDAAGVRMVAARPVAGFGWFAYDVHRSRYVEPIWGLEPRAFERSATSHNTLLTVAGELGLVGLALLLAAPVAAAVTGVRARAKPEAPLLLGYLAMATIVVMTTDLRHQLAPLATVAIAIGLLANLTRRDLPVGAHAA